MKTGNFIFGGGWSKGGLAYFSILFYETRY
jgi:hypothetical protein